MSPRSKNAPAKPAEGRPVQNAAAPARFAHTALVESTKDLLRRHLVNSSDSGYEDADDEDDHRGMIF